MNQIKSFKKIIMGWAMKLKKLKIKQKANKKNPFLETRDGFFVRQYNRRDEYIKHQQSKLPIMRWNLDESFESRVDYFTNEFGVLGAGNGRTILCLGARDGAEVHSLRKAGFLAIGIDLAYPLNNQFVHYGDFHNIPYPDDCFDFCYTNALDHMLEPDKIFFEIRRVLKMGGVFNARIIKGGREGYSLLAGAHESFAWKEIGRLVSLIEKMGFKNTKKIDLDKNWTTFLFQVIK